MEYRLILEPALDACYDRFPRVHVGTVADVDPRQWSGPSNALVVPGLPEVLRDMAEQLEAGMTTGPDPFTWLEP